MAHAALATIFAVAAVSKLLERSPGRDMPGLGPLPAGTVAVAARVLAVGELVLAALLLSPVAQWAALAALLFLIASGGIILISRRSPDADCGCFGGRLRLGDPVLRLARHLAFMAIAAAAGALSPTGSLALLAAGASFGLAIVLAFAVLGAVRVPVRRAAR